VALYVIDDRSLKPEGFRFDDFSGGEQQAKAWLELHKGNWPWRIESEEARNKLMELSGLTPKEFKNRELGAGELPALVPGDRVLVIWRETPRPIGERQPGQAPARVLDWRFGEWRASQEPG
jgi:hypothetical protein